MRCVIAFKSSLTTDPILVGARCNTIWFLCSSHRDDMRVALYFTSFYLRLQHPCCQVSRSLSILKRPRWRAAVWMYCNVMREHRHSPLNKTSTVSAAVGMRASANLWTASRWQENVRSAVFFHTRALRQSEVLENRRVLTDMLILLWCKQNSG